MTVRNLSQIMRPSRVALIGGGLPEDDSSLAIVARNLLDGGFTGEIFRVASGSAMVAAAPPLEEGGIIQNFPDLDSFPSAPDLAVISAKPGSIPELISKLGARGTKAALIVSGEIGPVDSDCSERLSVAIRDAAAPYSLRVLGFNSFGLMAPAARLNASFSHIQPIEGNLAFVTQSGSVLMAVLDWATSRNIGFSHLICLGGMVDIDFGDMLDYLANERTAHAVLLHIESLSHARKFMSAARIAARIKPVIVLKGDRYPGEAGILAAGSGGVCYADAAYGAAFRRAGMLRVNGLDEIFDAAETLCKAPKLSGDRLAVLTNGGGCGVLARDSLLEEGGRLADLSSSSMEKLDALFPKIWSRGNPVRVPRNVAGERYAQALDVLLGENGIDAVLALYCPNGMVSPEEVSRAVVGALKENSSRSAVNRVLTNWMGDGAAISSRKLFEENLIPTYTTYADAIRGFMHLARYRRNQDMLMETPPTFDDHFSPDTEKARGIVAGALGEGREWLSEAEARDVLVAYSIPVAPTRECAFELLIRMFEDARFGPVIVFGRGGEAFESLQDTALALPPLNMRLAREVMERTKVYRLLEGSRLGSEVLVDGVARTLVKISQLVCDMADIAEITIDPLRAGIESVWADGARVRVARAAVPQRLAIRPYPRELEETVRLPDGRTLLLRPLRPEDEVLYHRLFARLSSEEIHMRFMSYLRDLPHALAARLTQLDYDREMALALIGPGEAGEPDLYGGVRLMGYCDNECAEFAILLRGDMTGLGLGPMLLRRIIDYGRARGTKEIYGDILSENRPMLSLCRAFGFSIQRMPDDPGVMIATLRL